MGTNEDEAELIGRIYESTEVDSHGFGSLFQELGEALGAICGHHLVLEEGGGAPEAHSFGADPEGFSRYIAEYQDSDPRFHVAKERPNQIHSDVDVIDPHSFERSPIYVDLLRHFDIRYSLFFVTSVQPGIVMAQALIRPRHHSHFGQEEKRRLERLLPHLRRAMRLRWILQRLQQTPSDLESDRSAAIADADHRRGRQTALHESRGPAASRSG